MKDLFSVHNAVCFDVNCTILPLGFVLLLIDSYFDSRWVLFPSCRTSQNLIQYYRTILTPKLSPIPFPGYWFPLFAIYKLCIQCPSFYNYITLFLWLPISYRYAKILNNNNGQPDLTNWWTILVFRALLMLVNFYNVAIYCNCSYNPIGHVSRFFGLA